MGAPLIVLGHKNPDNDAISAAIGYAWLKNEVEKRRTDDPAQRQLYIPARLGPLPPETAGVLAKWGIEAPMVINNLYSRVSDVMTENPYCVTTNATLLDVAHLLRKHNVRALIVVNEDGTYRGVVSMRMIAERYVAATELVGEGHSHMAVAADLIASLDQRVVEILESDVLRLEPDARLDEATVDLMNSPLREAVVLDEDERPIGIVTRSDVAVHPHRKVILVDHNETRQSAPGIEDAEVVEIIDHHRIADVTTINPIKFLNLPVGSSATIVTLEAQRLGIEPPKEIAAVLLSAVLTDTIILKSPTATPIDRQVVDYLAGILGVDATEYGVEVFAFRGGDDNMPIDKLVSADSKEFAYGDGIVLIAQHETTNLKAVMTREDEMRAYLRDLVEKRGYACALLMVTDIIAEGSQFICEGDRRIVNRAFGVTCTGKGGVWMPGVLSRKKQVAARLLEA